MSALRVDAARNREAILGAARTALACSGSDVSLEEVARLAGVGVGTIYRRFPTKQSLLEALFDERMTAYACHTEAMAELAMTDPWRAFREHVTFLVEEQAGDRAFSEVLRDPVGVSAVFTDAYRRTTAASELLVERARTAGAIRADFLHADLRLLTDAVHGLVEHEGTGAPSCGRRLAAYMLQAFRASDGQALPELG